MYRFVAVFFLLLFIYACDNTPDALIFTNGTILTVDENNSVVEAVAIEDGKILNTGAFAAMQALLPDAAIIDLDGKTLIPGFVDAHSHFPGTGLKAISADLNSPPIGDTQNIEQLKASLLEWVEPNKPDKWIIGFGYDDTLLEEKRHPTKFDLDTVSTDQPILINHISGHLAVVNSTALALLNITHETENPVGGVIQKDPVTGEPNGILEETAAEEAQHALMQLSPADQIKAFLTSYDDYVSQGVTTAQNGLADKSLLNALGAASLTQLFPLRLVIWPMEDLARDLLKNDFRKRLFHNDFFQIGAVKLVADGSIQGFTGYLREPYHTSFNGDSSYRGYPRIPKEALTEQVNFFHSNGMQLAIHGNGDAAIDDILDAWEAAISETTDEDTRPIIIHSQMARDDQLDRMKSLGMTPSFFSLHTYYWGDRHRDIFMGPERAMRMSPAKSATDRDLRFSIHTDAPIVPMTPMLLMWSAVNRLSYGGSDLGEEQRISPQQALRAVTIDAAWQMHLEDSRGSIETGKFADLVILSDNPLDSTSDLKDIHVIETFIDGRSIYRKDDD